MPKKSSQHGSTLLLSLLIVMGAIAAAVSLASLVIGNIQQAKMTYYSTIAFYRAESGIEQALYSIRKNLSYPNDISATCALGGITVPNCAMTPTFNSATLEYSTILENQSVQFDVINFNSLNIRSGVDRLQIVCPNTSSLWLEISYVPITQPGGEGALWQVNEADKKSML